MSGRYSKKAYVCRPSSRHGKRKGSEHVAGRRAPNYTHLMINPDTGLPVRAEGRVIDTHVGSRLECIRDTSSLGRQSCAELNPTCEKRLRTPSFGCFARRREEVAL